MNSFHPCVRSFSLAAIYSTKIRSLSYFSFFLEGTHIGFEHFPYLIDVTCILDPIFAFDSRREYPLNEGSRNEYFNERYLADLVFP